MCDAEKECVRILFSVGRVYVQELVLSVCMDNIRVGQYFTGSHSYCGWTVWTLFTVLKVKPYNFNGENNCGND